MLLLVLVGPAAHAQDTTNNEGSNHKERSVFGAWVMKSETAPDGRVAESIYTGYTRCKIYDADSTYYSVQLHAVGDEMMIIAHEMGRYHLNDSLYMERDRVMPFEWVDDTTFITTFEGYQELMVRSSTMTKERMEEIRELVRQHPNDGDSPVKHFVLSTTERKLKAKNRVFLLVQDVIVYDGPVHITVPKPLVVGIGGLDFFKDTQTFVGIIIYGFHIWLRHNRRILG